LDFHLQTRFNPDVENEADLLPKGTLLHVKLLSAVDSDTARDGAELRGVLTEAVSSRDKVVVHRDAEAQLLFVVLRNRTHPQGFRFELIVTQVIDKGKPLDLTASLGASFADERSGESKSTRLPALGTASAAGAGDRITEKSLK